MYTDTCIFTKTHEKLLYVRYNYQILIPQRFKSGIKYSSIRTYRWADINSEHDLVLCNVKLKRTSRPHNSNRIRFKLNKLNDLNTSEL